MNRRRVDTVKVVERFAALDLVDVNEIRETLGLVNELLLERRQKHLFVELVGAAAHDFASGHQIHRRTDRDGRRQEGRFLRAFAHVFGNVITAKAHADRINRRRDETYGTQVYVAVGSLFQIVAGKYAQTTGIYLKYMIQTVFHTEICNGRTIAVGFYIHVIAELGIYIL